ncbi:M23 family metallopeptidase [Arthrobacter sp. PsM3]|uniref:M23 family metallopeptidase n=1 Tax=Arthrobacter sp. PsM3 TaxID=3030531 RepID=UPI00263BD393|nr:M23 family metallopeptidase [Arthrobacter sp. PsM3]MDN4643374.1 M23 family metallopeptidase [Arthrobacter sp. PsM3]
MPVPSRRGRRMATPNDRRRHRAAPATAGRHFTRGAEARPVGRGWIPGASALAAAVLLATGLPAAHAQLGHEISGPAAAQEAPETAGPGVEASAAATLTFPRTDVTTIAAPAQVAAVVSSAPASKGLGAPLAAMSVTSPFGLRTSPITGGPGELHTGLDLQAACRTAVFAAGAGTVVEAGWSPNGGGNRIVLDHGNGMKSTYNHLSSIETTIGADVARGQRLAGAGTTGNSTGCHLHFEVVRNGLTVDPRGWIQP